MKLELKRINEYSGNDDKYIEFGFYDDPISDDRIWMCFYICINNRRVGTKIIINRYNNVNILNDINEINVKIYDILKNVEFNNKKEFINIYETLIENIIKLKDHNINYEPLFSSIENYNNYEEFENKLNLILIES